MLLMRGEPSLRTVPTRAIPLRANSSRPIEARSGAPRSSSAHLIALKQYRLNTTCANQGRDTTSEGSMRLALLCLVAWLVLAAATLASSGARGHRGRMSPAATLPPPRHPPPHPH